MENKLISVYQNVELRKLREGTLSNIISILEENEAWKILINFIPENPKSPEFEQKYTEEHVRLIEEHAQKTGRKSTEILLEEWSTSGRVRPTLNTLKDVLVAANIYKAADLIANMLNEPEPPRPTRGPAARVNIDVSKLLKEDSQYNIHESNEHKQNKAMSNGTTAPMKSASDLIQFSRNVNSAIIPDLSILNNGTTAQMKTNEAADDGNDGKPSFFIPRLSAIMTNSPNNNFTVTETESSRTGTTENNTTDTNENNTTDELKEHWACQIPYKSSNNKIEKFTNDNKFDSQIFKDDKLTHFNYEELIKITNGFSTTIGSGGFGEVFIGEHSRFGQLAVKRTSPNIPSNAKVITRFFNTEVKLLSQFRHKNIVPIIGFSVDGPHQCIVCEYVEGGSLKENLARKYLNEQQRIKIMLGTAEGLFYLHRGTGANTLQDDFFLKSDTNKSKTDKCLHGDVKSDNILLTRDCTAKLCDFGLGKVFKDTHLQVTSVIGTKGYLAPEWQNGTITQKADIFSFGIVLLEILTGLPPIIEINIGDCSIWHYVEMWCKSKDFAELLDPTIPEWKSWKNIHTLSNRCILHDMHSRPGIDEICSILKNLK